jgi:hypothetical protein
MTMWDWPLWLEAIKKEFENFNSRGTLLEADQEGRAMKAKIILKYAYTEDYQFKRKARFVVCGFSQIKGVDYTETIAPTTTTFVVCHVCGALDFFTATFDVTAAFLEGSADCQMFARMPPCLSSIRERVEIVGNWYGLKQGPMIWNDQLNAILLELEFVRCLVHPCLYTRLRNKVFIILGAHVDDGLMGCNQETGFELFLTELNEHVTKSTITINVLKYTGIDMHVDRAAHTIELSHSVYIAAKIADEAVKLNESIPMSPAIKLGVAEPNPENKPLLSETGTFRFIADRARPDLLVEEDPRSPPTFTS